MAFSPVNELERLLVKASGDPAARAAFYRALVEHDLMVIREGQLPQHEGAVVLSEDTPLQVRLIEVEGKPYMPIFTSVERISAVVPGEVGYVAMAGRELLGALRGHDLLMNPGSDYGKFLTRGEVESILNGSIFDTPHAKIDVGGKRILLAQPKEYPHRLVAALREFLVKWRDVRRAYLAYAFMPEVDEAPHTLIGIETTGDWERLAAEAAPVVAGATRPGEIVDFVKLPAAGPDVIRDYMVGQTRPFYERRKKWLGLI